MFDIGFSEIVVIAVVALIVIGPERLPGVARTLGHLFGRMQRYVNEVKSDIQREIELDELKKLRENVEASAREIEQSVSRDFNDAERELRAMQAALTEPAGQNQAASSSSSSTVGSGEGQATAESQAAPPPPDQSSGAAPLNAFEDAVVTEPRVEREAPPRTSPAGGELSR